MCQNRPLCLTIFLDQEDVRLKVRFLFFCVKFFLIQHFKKNVYDRIILESIEIPSEKKTTKK